MKEIELKIELKNKKKNQMKDVIPYACVEF